MKQLNNVEVQLSSVCELDRLSCDGEFLDSWKRFKLVHINWWSCNNNNYLMALYSFILISNRGRWSPLSLFRQVHLGEGKSEYNPPFSGLRAASTWEAVGFCGNHRHTDVLTKLSSWLGGWSPFCGTTAGTQPKCGNGGVSDAVTSSELGDRQSSHPVKNPASVLWQVFRGVASCCLPRFQGQPQHLKYQNWIYKNPDELATELLETLT